MTLGGNWLAGIGVPVPQADDSSVLRTNSTRMSKRKLSVLCMVSYSLPDSLHGHIQTIAPMTRMFFGSLPMQGQKRRMRPSGVAKAGSGELVTVLPNREVFVTPWYLHWLYKAMGYVPAAVDKNALGIAGYRMQHQEKPTLLI